MKPISKILVSIPCLLVIGIIPYNFFVDLSLEDSDQLFIMIVIIQLLLFLGLAYTLFQLWKNPKASKSEKWTWTLLMLFVFQPITTLIYLWLVESTLGSKT